jgi:DNA polymerase III delta prime subunit
MSIDFLWVEEYRPKTIDDCILPQSLKTLFTSFIQKGELSNILLSGPPGIGKTTVAKALCDQLNCDWVMINGSEEGGIDVLRNKIKNFASTVSLSGGKKVVILDEADYLNPQSTQPALRGFIEEFHKNCRFILTCNFKNRLIDPLHSRFSIIEFRINPKDKPRLASKLFERAVYILKEQNVDYDEPVLAELIKKHFPDFRKLINELQRYSVSGKIDAGILVNISDENLKTLVSHLKRGENGYEDMRKWVVNNLDNDPVKIFRKIYDSLNSSMEQATIPAVILTIAKYQYQSAFVADQEVNLVACLTEIMSMAKFK